jgi:hypothetical protein
MGWKRVTVSISDFAVSVVAPFSTSMLIDFSQQQINFTICDVLALGSVTIYRASLNIREHAS